jgi:diacylglycerol kinase family enzyme
LCILNPAEFQDYIEMGFRFAGGLVSSQAPYYTRKVKSVDIEALSEPPKLSRLQQVRRKLTSFFAGPPQEQPPTAKQVTAMIDGDACGTTPMHIEVVPNAVNVLVLKDKLKRYTE